MQEEIYKNFYTALVLGIHALRSAQSGFSLRLPPPVDRESWGNCDG
jgi:hypothetical protein